MRARGFPIYTKGDRPKAGGGEAAYWLPILALFTGARVEELAQLLPEDAKEEDGVAVLDISDRRESQKVKNKGSRRRVPVHQELIRLGFLDYAAKMRKAKKARLFPDLVPDKWGHCSGNFSKWWGHFARKKLGITDKRKVFHSFRHSFKDGCRACGIEEEVHDALTGHSGGGVGRGYGGMAYPLPPLVSVIGNSATRASVCRISKAGTPKRKRTLRKRRRTDMKWVLLYVAITYVTDPGPGKPHYGAIVEVQGLYDTKRECDYAGATGVKRREPEPYHFVCIPVEDAR